LEDGISLITLVELAQSMDVELKSETLFEGERVLYDNVTSSAFDSWDLEKLEISFIRQMRALKNSLHARNIMHPSLDHASDQFIKRNGLSGFDARVAEYIIRDRYCDTFYGGPSNLTSFDHFWSESSFFGENFFVKKGFNQLTEKLAENLDIRLSTPVKGVSYSNSYGVRISTVDSGVFKARKAIITVPLGVLKSNGLTFDPPLPEEKQEAIDRLRMGSLEKVIAVFPKKVWGGEILFLSEQNTQGYFPAIYDITDLTGKPSIIAWHGGYGSTINLQMTDEEIIESLQDQMSLALGQNVPRPTSFFVTRWQENQYIRGSYSYIPTGSNPEDMDLLKAPVDNILYFAGEATNKHYYGTTHSAMISGADAALELINADSPRKSRTFETLFHRIQTWWIYESIQNALET